MSFEVDEFVRVVDRTSPFFEWVGQVKRILPAPRITSPMVIKAQMVEHDGRGAKHGLSLSFVPLQLERITDTQTLVNLKYQFGPRGENDR